MIGRCYDQLKLPLYGESGQINRWTVSLTEQMSKARLHNVAPPDSSIPTPLVCLTSHLSVNSSVPIEQLLFTAKR